ncbi:hypothetical protein E3Q18_01471 [Wallemia mellicola]|nr:hypothetical protein E3Q18_01471 [Wallemia mellicola]
MNFTLTRAIIVAVILGTAQAAHIAACTENKDGTGPYDSYATEACCGEQSGIYNVHGHYSEKYGDCRTGIVGGNSEKAVQLSESDMVFEHEKLKKQGYQFLSMISRFKDINLYDS